MSLGYRPTINTKIVFDYLDFPIQGSSGFAALLAAGQPYFRLCSYLGTNSYVLCYGNQQEFPTGFTINGAVEVGNFYIKVNGTTVYEHTPTVDAFSAPMDLTLGADKPSGGDLLDDVNTKIGRFCIYEGDTLIAEFIPALDENNVAGMYNATNDTFLYSVNSSKPWTAGPLYSSINVSYTGTSIAASGGTASIEVESDYAWTASTSASWVTLSTSTGDTGTTTITATFAANSGDRRIAQVDFINATGDTDEVQISQKKEAGAGTPVYLGGDEVTEVFLGGDAVSEAYLGLDLVFASGPFVGMKVSPQHINFSDYSLTGQIKIKSSETWSITAPAWISCSTSTGDTGETVVTLTATSQTAFTSGSVVVTSANYSASVNVAFNVVEFVDYIYQANPTNYVQANRIDTEVPHTSTAMTVEIEYYGMGGNSDRMAGYQQNDPGCTSDSQDFRIFGLSNGSLDYMTSRKSTSEAINSGYQDITFGDNYVINNVNGTTILTASTVGAVPSPNCHIYVDVSWIKVKRVIIRDGNTVLFDGHAAILGDTIGLYDTVSNTMKYNADLTMAYDAPTGYSYVGGVIASTFNVSTGVTTAAVPAFPGYKVRVKGKFRSGADYADHYGMALTNATGTSTNNTSFGVQKIYHQGDVSYYSYDVIWDSGNIGEWNLGYSHSGETIDWTLEDKGVYDNKTGQYLITGMASTAVTANPMIIDFRAMALSEVIIYSNNAVAFYGVAATRDSDEQGGLYDTVSGNFYTDENNTVISV